MAQERIYQSQVGPAQPVGLPGASPAAFGAEIGGSIAELGQARHRRNVQKYDIEQRLASDIEATNAALAIANAKLVISTKSDDARAEPGGIIAGHTNRRAVDFDEATKGIVEKISDKNVRRKFEVQIAEYRSSFLQSEHAAETAVTVARNTENLRQAGKQISAYAATSRDPNALSLAHKAVDTLVDSQQAIGQFAEPVRRELHQQVTLSYTGRMQDTNPQGLLDAIDRGAFNDVLDGTQLNSLRGGAQIELNRVRAAERAKAAEALELKRRELATRRAELDTGAGTPQDLFDLAQQYEAIGDAPTAVELRAKGGSRAASIGYRDETPVQLDQRIAALTAEQQRGGLSPEKASLLAGLKDLNGELKGMLSQPGGVLLAQQFATGRPIPPLNVNDPASMRQRGDFAEAATERFGRASVEPITETEMPVFKDLMGQGPAGKVKALDAIRAFGSPRVVAGAARQIAGDEDASFRIAATLLPSIGRAVLMGPERLKTNPKLINRADAARLFNLWYGQTARAVGGTFASDILSAAIDYYAAGVSGPSETWDKDDEGRFAQAIETVMGQTRGADGRVRGGVARTRRGIVLVPPDRSPDSLMATFARAKEPEYQAAAGGRSPHWPDGTRMTREELARTLPTYVGNGRYAFRGADGRPIRDGQGGVYDVDIYKMRAQ